MITGTKKRKQQQQQQKKGYTARGCNLKEGYRFGICFFWNRYWVHLRHVYQHPPSATSGKRDVERTTRRRREECGCFVSETCLVRKTTTKQRDFPAAWDIKHREKQTRQVTRTSTTCKTQLSILIHVITWASQQKSAGSITGSNQPAESHNPAAAHVRMVLFIAARSGYVNNSKGKRQASSDRQQSAHNNGQPHNTHHIVLFLNQTGETAAVGIGLRGFISKKRNKRGTQKRNRLDGFGKLSDPCVPPNPSIIRSYTPTSTPPPTISNNNQHKHLTTTAGAWPSSRGRRANQTGSMLFALQLLQDSLRSRFHSYFTARSRKIYNRNPRLNHKHTQAKKTPQPHWMEHSSVGDACAAFQPYPNTLRDTRVNKRKQPLVFYASSADSKPVLCTQHSFDEHPNEMRCKMLLRICPSIYPSLSLGLYINIPLLSTIQSLN